MLPRHEHGRSLLGTWMREERQPQEGTVKRSHAGDRDRDEAVRWVEATTQGTYMHQCHHSVHVTSTSHHGQAQNKELL